jgi:hypothetical protein
MSIRTEIYSLILFGAPLGLPQIEKKAIKKCQLFSGGDRG